MGSTKKIQDPKELNLGYKFDSVAYTHEMTWRDSIDSKYPPNMRFGRTEFVNKSLSDVKTMMGEPESVWFFDLEYGFEKTESGYLFGLGVCRYMDSECHIVESQACYRCMKILNIPQSTVVEGRWRDSTRYVELYFLVNEADTITFDGFQAGPDFQWLD